MKTKSKQVEKRISAGTIVALGVLAIVVVLVCVLIISGLSTDDQPQATVTTYDENEKMPTVGYDFDMTQYLAAPDLSSIEISNSLIDAEYDSIVESIRLYYATYSDSEDESYLSSLYDRVTVNYRIKSCEAQISDEFIEAFSAEDEPIVIGTGELLEAYDSEDDSLDTLSFEDQLIGHTVGETFDVVIRFADDYEAAGYDVSPLRGVKTTFEVTITAIEVGELAKLTDSLIATYTGSEYTSIDDYRSYVYDYYKGLYAYEAAIDAIHINSYPEEEVDNAIVLYLYSLISKEYSSDSNVSEEIIEEYYSKYSEEAYQYACEAVAERMKLEYLFDLTDTTLTVGEYYQYLEADYSSSYYVYYMTYGITTQANMESYFGKENLILQYTYEKLLDTIAEYVTWTD